MIKAFGVRNYTCFNDWMELDCTLNDQVPERFHNGNNIAPILCLKGANASGKTNAIKAIVFLKNFIEKSFTDSVETSFFIDTFFNNSNPTEFYIEFITEDKKDYLYELKIDRECVYYEKLSLKGKVVLHRELQELKNSRLFNDIKIPFNSNVSVISAARYYPETQNLVISIHSFFNNIFTNVTRLGLTEYPDMISDRSRASLFSKLYKDENEAFVFMQNFLRKFDLGIEKIEIDSLQQLSDGRSFYYPIFTHSSNGNTYVLLGENESSGTRALFTNLLYYYHALHYGGLLLLDEFDINLHPDILPFLIQLFLNQESNPNNAQLIFITHNNDIMELAGKYRTYMFEKKDNQSYCYRLDELESSLIRNDRSIVKLYTKGLLGGVPQVTHGL